MIIQHLTEAIMNLEAQNLSMRGAEWKIYTALRQNREQLAEHWGLDEVIYLDERLNVPDPQPNTRAVTLDHIVEETYEIAAGVGGFITAIVDVDAVMFMPDTFEQPVMVYSGDLAWHNLRPEDQYQYSL